MAEENQNPINQTDQVQDNKNPVQERIEDLSSKVKETATQRDAEKAAREAAERERDFYAGFADTVATNPSAKDFKDDIKAKVMAGYTVQDATFAVLGAAGKLGNAPAPVQHQNPAGGSAPITPPQGGTKAIHEMTREERRAELQKAVERGDIALS